MGFWEIFLVPGKIENGSRKGWHWGKPLDSIPDPVDRSLCMAWVLVMDRKASRAELRKWTGQFSWPTDETGPSYFDSHFFFFNIVIRVPLTAETVKSLFTKRETQVRSWGSFSWRREWLPTAEFLPGEFHGQRSLEGYSLWDSQIVWARLSRFGTLFHSTL